MREGDTEWFWLKQLTQEYLSSWDPLLVGNISVKTGQPKDISKKCFQMFRSSPSVPVAVSEIQNKKQKNLRGGATYAPMLVISRGA